MKLQTFALSLLSGALMVGCSSVVVVQPTGIKVTGKLVAPDGSTPLSNALVYVAGSAATVQAQADLPCGTPPVTTLAAACTNADGTFNLSVKTGLSTFKLNFQKGSFKGEATVNASGGEANVGNVKVSNDPTQGAPRMAVVTGSFDHIQNVLAKLGFGTAAAGELVLGTEKFDLYDGNDSLEGNYKDMAALFQDADKNGKADLFNYQIVFLNCGVDEETNLTDANINTLRAYVQAGGKLYASDLAYDYVEQAFPEFVDFQGSDETAEAAKEELGAAENGKEDITTNATVDPALKAWLQSVTCTDGSCLNQNGTVHIEGFLSGWAVINGAHNAQKNNVKVWATGDVVWGMGVEEQNGVKPLSVTFPFGTGKVLYTSYHTEPGTGEGILPQERILQYLVFEL